MKTTFLSLLLALATPSLHAGGFNVVHLGPEDVLKFEIASGGATQEFNLAHGEATGSFLLPDKEATLKVAGLDIDSLEIPAKAGGRIAVLHSSGDGYRWRLLPSEPGAEKWALRVVNLATEPAVLVKRDEKTEIAPGSEFKTEPGKKSDLRVRIGDSELNESYQGDEPCAVVAFLYRKNERWNVLFVPDR